MSIELNHLLIFARDKAESASFLADILGLPPPAPAGFFLALEVANNVTLHFGQPGVEFTPQHYAFLVSDRDFDASMARIQERGIEYAADPRWQRVGEINTNHGGRGAYFRDPSGHGMEIITRPYGSGDGGA
jgi:catechol 2,3-dioxygenase-like lactoylglutathione lyase family enzyme